MVITVRVSRFGLLKSADRSLTRTCKVLVNRHVHFVDGGPSPLKVLYSGLTVIDCDDWPDGDYVVKYEGGTELLRKKGIHYSRR